jgi:hypothetical protein
MKSIDGKSFLLGVLAAALVAVATGAGYDGFSTQEANRLRILASYVQDDGNLNMGNHRIIMLGSSIYDDGSDGGGLILRGGANRISLHGAPVIYENPQFPRGAVDLNANLNMGDKKIMMLGSSIYDNGSEGGGLILRGGANRVSVHGAPIIYDNPEFKMGTVGINANLDLGPHRIIMLGSSIYDDGSEGGGLQIRGGAGRIHLFGQTLPH